MQCSLAFYPRCPIRFERPERVFFALLPDHETALSIDSSRRPFMRENRLDGRCLALANLHLSLRHLGDYSCFPAKIIDAAQQAANTVSAGPCDICFDHLMTLGRPTSTNGKPRKLPLVLYGECEGLGLLCQRLDAAVTKTAPRAVRYFTPHMTLAYISEPVAPQRIKPIHFVAREFMLIHSQRGLSRYTIIGRWPLKI